MGVEYSVLMSVYAAEKPERLWEGLHSILEQTVPASQLVLVCDGPLTDALNTVVNTFERQFPATDIVRLPKNLGLGPALNVGLSRCKNEFVVRMDSDDVAYPYRCERQLTYMNENGLDLYSAAVQEFIGDRQITGARVLPVEHSALLRFARRRNPMNHPCVVFRKSMVEKAGGYRYMPYFEDYDLWARMILAGARLGNAPEPLLFMRAGENLYRRRSGLTYCGYIVRFWREMLRIGFCGRFRFFINIVIRCAVSVMPVKGIQYVYGKGLRSA